jgi:hydrogenase nickel incorporation protein HypA/HybF
MHELSIVASLYEIMEEKAKEQKAKTVTRVKLQVGILSGVVPEFLETAFDIFKKDTIKCRSCRSERTFDELVFICAQCGSTDIETLAGKELILETLELSF